MQLTKCGGDAIVSGDNSIEYLGSMQAKRAIIVTTGSIACELGQIEKIETILKKNNVETVCYEDVEPDPEISNILHGCQTMLEFEPDLIIALGGGSAIDSAKAMWVGYEHPGYDNIEKFMYKGIVPPMRQKARLVAIPTTSGTGSEVTCSTVISDKLHNRKFAVRDNQLIPDVAILDPAFTQSMPPSLTANTGMDALTHAIEAYTTRFANDFTDAFAQKAVVQIFEYLPKAYAEPNDPLFRSKMQNSATLAGLAFESASLGIAHSLSHALGAIFHVPHGLANAIALPYVIRFNKTRSAEAAGRYKTLEHLCQLLDLADAIDDLKQKLNIPSSLDSIIPEKEKYMEALDILTRHALADRCTDTNPVNPSDQEMKDLFNQVYYGTR